MPLNPRVLSMDIIERQRVPSYDTAPYVDTLRFALDHGGAAEVDLDVNETPKGCRKRLTSASKGLLPPGQKIKWIKNSNPSVIQFMFYTPKKRAPKLQGESPNGAASGRGRVREAVTA